MYKKCKPIEDKIMIVLGTVDDLESEIEEIKKSLDNKYVQNSSQSPDKKDELEVCKLSIQRKPTTREEKASRGNVLSQILEGEIKTLKTEYEIRFQNLEMKPQSNVYNKSNLDKFMDTKGNNELFKDVNHSKRLEDAKNFQSESGIDGHSKKYLLQNEMVLYQLYSRYKEMVSELDIYKQNIMDNLRFGSKKTEIFIKDHKQRKRSRSLQFKVFKVKEDILGKIRIDYLIKENPEEELKLWNNNMNGRLEELEKL